MTTFVKNTDKSYPCVNCGADSASIIREGVNPRLKCGSCNFMYDASQSEDAVKAGAIPDGPPKIEHKPDTNPRRPAPDENADVAEKVDGSPRPTREGESKLPRTIKWVVVSKDRTRYAFCNDKTLKKTIFEWETQGRKYELFELQPKKASAKVDIE